MPDQSAGNRPTPPELGTAVQNLVTAVQKGGTNIMMWVLMALVTAAPVAVTQIQSQRAPGSVEYLNQADFQILGPDSAESGSLVRQTVSDYEPNDVAWFVVNNGDECDCQQYSLNGAELVFSMPAEGPAEVTCSIIRRGKLYLTRKVVKQATPAPVEPVVEPEPVEPVVEPEPEPEPVEPQPEPLTKIGKKILRMAEDADLSVSDAKQVARNLRRAAADSEGTNPRSLVIRTVELNEDLDLPEDVADGIKVLLQTLAENGELMGMEQHLDVWGQMADGFEAYAK